MNIGKLQSFENKDIWYLIKRTGKAVRDGGKGVEWTCSCPYGRRTQPCEHLLFVFKNSVNLPKKDNFSFLKDGRGFYRKFLQEQLDHINHLMYLVDNKDNAI